ncbi:MAG: POTRA domain-containing protein, partial [Bacillota bacterium]
MIAKNLLLTSVVLAALSCPAWAKKALDLSTLPQDVRAGLIKHFPQADKDKISLSELDEIVRYLQLQPQFDRVQIIDPGNGTYKLQYFHARRIGKISYQGARFYSDNEISNIFTVKNGDVFNQQELVEQGEKLRLSYKDQGFFNAVVDIEMPTGAKGDVDIIVKVTENKRTLIHAIVVQSPNNVLNKGLLNKLDSRIDDPLTEKSLAEINKKARAYLNSERYVRADFSGPTITYSSDESEATLTYRVDKPERYIFEYRGVRLLGRGSVEDALDLDNYYSGNPSVGTELAQKIRNYYISEGYARAEVNSEEEDTDKPFVRKVTFNIEEGPRVKISAINMMGKISRHPKHYANFITAHSSKTVADGYYNKEDVDLGLKNLILDMQNEGFLQAKIISTRLTYNREKTEVTLYVNLDEGPLTTIQTVNFTGNSAYTNEQLLKITDLKPGPLKLKQIETAIANVKNYYHENGYIEMYLLNEREDLVTYDATNTQATLNFKIFEGPQVRAASIVLEGNTFTKDHVLYQELDIRKNELITPQKIEDSITHLQRTGFFSTVEVRTLEEKTNIADRTVLVKVSEREPGLFTLGAGATNERQFTLRGYAGVAYRNLFGTGRGISLRLEGNYNVADVKYLESKVVLGYLEPYLFDSHIRGRINITKSSLITDYNIRQVTDLNSYTYTLEKDLTNHILGTWDVYSLAQVRDYGLDNSYP